MRRKTIAGAAASGLFALAGCSMFHTMAVANDCNTDGDCSVTVEVTPNTGSSGPACSIADLGDVIAKRNRKPEIVWAIHNNGGGQFKFAQGKGGVALKTGTWDPGVFTDKGSANGGAEYRIKDHNNNRKRPGDPPDSFTYKVTVVKPDGTAGCVLDPILVNDGCEDGSC
jgi:hypothetical protein